MIAYGLGPLILSPLSEIPKFGRNPFYVYPLFIYVLFQIGASLVKNFGGLLAFRFLTGLVGSAPLASGGASMGDLYSPLYLTFA